MNIIYVSVYDIAHETNFRQEILYKFTNKVEPG